jgi:formylglycine-generating enzyme required for sulfatase activity
MQREQVYENEMISIPSGNFLMGTSAEQITLIVEQIEDGGSWKEKGWFSREQPQQTVWLPLYFIAKFPVTVGDYRHFIASGGYMDSTYWTKAGWEWRCADKREKPTHWEESRWAGDDSLPVVGVSWFEASAYCRWLSDVTGALYYLPTECQWEKAARGTDGYLFPWGDYFKEAFCNTRQLQIDHTLPVGSFEPFGNSPFGVVDMVGNVSEWTASRFSPYPYVHQGDSEDPEGIGLRTTRGGSWFSPTIRARCAARGMNDPWFSDHDLGFRVAKSG